MLETLPFSNLILVLLTGIFVATASGLVGSFLALRRMTLLSDALSHVAIPGIALGVLLNFNPLLGGLALLLIATFFIWGIENKTKLAIESITGVLFTSALAIGALLIEEHELLETFFGSVENTTPLQAIIQVTASLLIIFIILKNLKKLVLFSIAPDLGTAEGNSNRKTELLLLILIATTITIGISFVGVLLMSALLIIPAVSARNLASSYKNYVILSMAIAIVSLLIGVVLGNSLGVNAGITTTLVGTGIFSLTLISRLFRG